MISNSLSRAALSDRIASELPETLINRIHDVTAEAMCLLNREDTIARVTVIRGYLHLSVVANKPKYVRKLSVALIDLSEFVMERGRHNLARNLLILSDEIRALQSSPPVI